MNKKTLLIVASVAALLLVVGGVFAAMHFNSANDEMKEEKRSESVKTNTDDTLLFYVNLGQLGEKSAIGDVLTDANRRLLSIMFSNGLDSKYVNSLLSNLNATGLDIDKPIYSYSNIVDDNLEMVIAADVADVNAVDDFVEFAYNLVGGSADDIVRDGKTRSLSLGNFTIAYNEKRFVLATCLTDDYYADGSALAAAKALKRPKLNLSGYKGYDMAFSLKLMPIIDMVCVYTQATIDDCLEYLEEVDEWEREWVMYEIDTLKQNLKQMEELKKYLDNNAAITAGLTFESGKIVLDMSIDGVEYEDACRKVSNDHLAYIDNDAIGVMNVGIDGKKASKLLSKYITSDYAEMLGLSRNEFNIYFGIFCDAIESINGDVTIALNDFSYYGEDVEVVMAVDVDDDYIISNIAQFGSGFLKKRGNNCYGIDYAGNRLTLGQEDDTFYATINENFEPQNVSAEDTAWAHDVKNSYGYLVVDINNLMKNSYISAAFRDAMYYMDSFSAELANNFVKSCSHAYLTIDSPTSAQLVLAFDDQETNSLEQLVRMFVPAIIHNIL